MNRRGFIASAVGVAAIAALPVAMASVPHGLKITCSDPPEPGFEYRGQRAYEVFCDGVKVPRVVRVSEPDGIAWSMAEDQEPYRLARNAGDPNAQLVVEEVRGKITLKEITR